MQKWYKEVVKFGDVWLWPAVAGDKREQFIVKILLEDKRVEESNSTAKNIKFFFLF